MKELKAPEKVTQKMTHDGAVTENLATGEVENISGREAETDLSDSSEESAGVAADLALLAAEHHEAKNARKAEKADAQAVQDGLSLIHISEPTSPPVCNSPTKNGWPRICRKRSDVLTGRRIGWTRRRSPSPQRGC